MKINNTKELKQALRDGPYAWPGGYNTYFIADDGEALCHTCVKDNFRQVLTAVIWQSANGWHTVAVDINYEDEHLYCAHCEEKIESAYGEEQ